MAGQVRSRLSHPATGNVSRGSATDASSSGSMGLLGLIAVPAHDRRSISPERLSDAQPSATKLH